MSAPRSCPICGNSTEYVYEAVRPDPTNDLICDEPTFIGWVCGECGWEEDDPGYL